ncbi:MAG: RloB family protein [Hydrogenophaga sp.]|uniref:RloB family protein n=1 Tax=Hydrogenophaga sp. TaxID=1904254 RepID=UPI004036C16A
MGRSTSSFARRGPRYKPQPRILVLCEDTKSSKTYFMDASIHFRSHAVVEFAHCGHTDPLGIVRNAIKRSTYFENVYCVIDRDSHANFDEAIDLAEPHEKVVVLPSYPCFEYWLLLHFGYTRAPFMPSGGASAADKVVQQLRTKVGMDGYAKGSVNGLFRKLLENLDPACERGERSSRDAKDDGQVNPSTSLHKLVQKLKDLGELPES